MMKPSEILREAVKLDWTQGVFARDRDGNPVDTDSSSAVCFCSLGRIERLSSDIWPKYYLDQVIGVGLIAVWNDRSYRTREEVDAAFLEAAELAESEGR